MSKILPQKETKKRIMNASTKKPVKLTVEQRAKEAEESWDEDFAFDMEGASLSRDASIKETEENEGDGVETTVAGPRGTARDHQGEAVTIAAFEIAIKRQRLFNKINALKQTQDALNEFARLQTLARTAEDLPNELIASWPNKETINNKTGETQMALRDYFCQSYISYVRTERDRPWRGVQKFVQWYIINAIKEPLTSLYSRVKDLGDEQWALGLNKTGANKALYWGPFFDSLAEFKSPGWVMEQTKDQDGNPIPEQKRRAKPKGNLVLVGWDAITVQVLEELKEWIEQKHARRNFKDENVASYITDALEDDIQHPNHTMESAGAVTELPAVSTQFAGMIQRHLNTRREAAANNLAAQTSGMDNLFTGDDEQEDKQPEVNRVPADKGLAAHIA